MIHRNKAYKFGCRSKTKGQKMQGMYATYPSIRPEVEAISNQLEVLGDMRIPPMMAL